MRSLRLSVFMILSAAVYSGAAHAGSDWYLGVMAGYARVSYDATLGVTSNRVHDRRYTYALELGYRPVKYLAAEVAYHRYGHYHGSATRPCAPTEGCVQKTTTPLSAGFSAWSFLLVPQLPLGHGLSAFIDGGLLHWSMTGVLGTSITTEEYGNSGLYGAGLRYDFPGHVSLKVGYQHSEIKLDETSVGAEWRF